MLPDRVSNPGPLTYESGALPIALRGPAPVFRTLFGGLKMLKIGKLLFSCTCIDSCIGNCVADLHECLTKR